MKPTRAFSIDIEAKMTALKPTGGSVPLGKFGFSGSDRRGLVAAIVKKATQKIKDKGIEDKIDAVSFDLTSMEIDGQNFDDFKDDLVSEIEEELTWGRSTTIGGRGISFKDNLGRK